MATYVPGFINDLSAVKDNVKLRVRIVRTWMQPVFGKQHVNNLELILCDEQDTRIQGQVRMALVNRFKNHLEEGKVVTLQGYSLGEIQPKYRIVKKGMRLSFLASTLVEPCPDFTGSVHGFQFRPFNSIVGLKQEEDGQFDVIGQVVACGDLDNFEKNGVAVKKKPLVLIDAEGIEMNCTLWGLFAAKFCDFLSKCVDHGAIIGFLQLAMMKIWDAKMGVQNGYNGTKLYLFNGKEAIDTSEFNDVDDFRKSLADKQGNEKSENATSRISVASKNSTKEDFVLKSPLRNIVDLLDVAQGVHSVIVGTICVVQEDDCWWYIGCRVCKKKVVKSSDIVDLDSETPQKHSTGGPTEWFCSKCKINMTSIKTMFRLQIRVQDETGTVSLSLFNDECQAILGRSAYQLCDKYGKSADNWVYPNEIQSIVGKKFAFKVAIDDFNSKKLLPVFTVLRLSNDQEIIESLRPSATPHKDNEATSGAVPEVTPFDLESQTDDNTTPTNTKATSNKRQADSEAGSESSNGKKQLVEVKVEKDP